MLASVSALYAGLLALVYVGLFVNVGRARNAAGVSLGDGGDPALLVAMRAQANYVENVPLILLLLALIEAGGAAKWWVHLLGCALLAARVAHPFGLSVANARTPARAFGAGVTGLVLVASALTAIWQFLR